MRTAILKHASLLGASLVLAISCNQQESSNPSASAQNLAKAPSATTFTTSDYQTALKDSIYFYDAQKCGPNVAVDNVFSWRKACHVQDQNAAGGDMTGGMHDAGDFLKMGLTQGYTPTIIGWGLYENRAAYDSAGITTKALSTLKYFTDYFLKSHPNSGIFYYEIGLDSDHDTWRPPENDSGVRTAPSGFSYWADSTHAASDICGETAGALALMSLNYQSTDATYAAKCLTAAKEIYAIGKAKLGVGRSNQDGTFYASSGYYDHLAVGALWLNAATGDASYLTDATTYIGKNTKSDADPVCWDGIGPLVKMKLYQLTGTASYKTAVQTNLNAFKSTKASPGGLTIYSTDGNLSYVGGETFLALYYGKVTGDTTYNALAKKNADYVLGNNPKGWSYMIGFGPAGQWPQHPSHCAANGYVDNTMSSTSAWNNVAKYTLTGGIVGGPNASDVFTDNVAKYQSTEVGDDYNSGWVGTFALLAGSGPATVAVTVSPTTASLATNATQQFTASVTGTTNTAVTWTATGGTVSASGLYTAPATAGTYTVKATSTADTTKSASATVTVTAPVVAVSINPTTASILVNATQQFTASVTGTTNTAVTWTATGGTVSTSGLYTAPATAGTYTVKATSAADTTKSASATVTVTTAPVVAVTINPTSVSLSTGATQQFTATVTGTTNTTVTWTATGGTVSTSGLYTAPATAGTYTVKATSAADTTKSASATVTVTSGTTDSNIAPSGTAYGWAKNTSATSNSNKVAMAGLNDNNLTTDVDLNSAGDAANAWEAAGVIFSSAKTVSSAKFINGTVTSGGDGFLTANCSCQYTTNGTTWVATGWTISPAYPNSSSASGKTYTFSGTTLSGVLGVRVVGQVRTTDTSYHWIVKEVQVIGH